MTAYTCQKFNTPFAVNKIVPYYTNITVTITTGVISAMTPSVNDTAQTYHSLNGCFLSGIYE